MQHADGKGGWGKGVKGVDTTLLYRTDQLGKEIEVGQTIAVVEGEKDVDNLWRLDFATTCNAHGAGKVGKKPKWTAVHSAQLADAEIVVFNDNDAAGYAHADAICRCSHGIAKRGRRLDLKNHWPEIPKGGDVSDWLAVGGEHTAEGLKTLIDAAPDYVPAETSKTGSEAAGNSETLDDNAELARLAQLSAFDYERARKAAADALNGRAPILDKLDDRFCECCQQARDSPVVFDSYVMGRGFENRRIGRHGSVAASDWNSRIACWLRLTFSTAIRSFTHGTTCWTRQR